MLLSFIRKEAAKEVKESRKENKDGNGG